MWRFVIAFLLILCAPLSARADWQLFDDFSSGTIDSSKWGRSNPFADVTWSVVNGALRVEKVAGSTEIVKDVLRLYNLPSGVNGMRADIRVTSRNDYAFNFQMKMDAEGGTFNFGSGDEASERESATGMNAPGGGTNPISYVSCGECSLNYEDRGVSYLSGDRFNSNEVSQSWITYTMVFGTNLTDLSMGDACYHIEVNNFPSFTAFDGKVRVRSASPESTFTVDVDNVYVHTGEFSSICDGKSRVIIVPMN